MISYPIEFIRFRYTMEGMQRMWQLKWRNWITGTFFWSSHPHENMPAEALKEPKTNIKPHL